MRHHQCLVILPLLIYGFNISVLGECYIGCSGSGDCNNEVDGGTCECYEGFYDSENIAASDCTLTIYELEGYGHSFIFLRVWYCFWYTSGLFLSLLGLFYAKQIYENQAAIFNLTKFILCFNSFLALISSLHWLIDPYGINHVLPFLASGLLEFLADPIVLTMFVCLLFHWIEMYIISVRTLKRNEMIQKINSRYQEEITVEDILQKVQFVHKLRAPAIIIVILAFTITILLEVLAGGKGELAITIIWEVYFLGFWVVMCLSFTYFGPQLMRIMPDVLAAKMKKLIIGVVVLSSVSLLVEIGVVIVNHGIGGKGSTPEGFIGIHVFYETPYVFFIFVHLLVYVSPNKKFPYVYNPQQESDNCPKSASREDSTLSSFNIAPTSPNVLNTSNPEITQVV